MDVDILFFKLNP